MKSFLIRWAVTTIGVLIASEVVSGIDARTTTALIGASLLLGIFNAVLRPIMLILTLPLLILTLGLFTLVINALLLYLVGWIMDDFQVAGFWAAFKGSILISLVSLLATAFLGKEKRRERDEPPGGPPPPRPPIGSGPIIDV